MLHIDMDVVGKSLLYKLCAMLSFGVTVPGLLDQPVTDFGDNCLSGMSDILG